MNVKNLCKEMYINKRIFRIFEQRLGFPACLGVMDRGSLFVEKPSVAEPEFYRKKFPGLNCEVVSDINDEILSILVHAGSYTDMSIWNASFLKLFMERLRKNAEITRNERKYYLMGKTFQYR